jgi:rhomboid protease GluP
MQISSLSCTYILIGINAAVFLLETAAGGSTRTDIARRFGAQTTQDLQRGQLYRLFTSMFVHFGALHILCNMYSLYSLGPALEYICGKTWFLIIYLVSGLAGNLLTWASESRSHRYSVSAGASGAVFGLLGCYLVLALLPAFRSSISLSGILITLAINLFYGISNRRINMKAHLGGLIGGVCITLLMLVWYRAL